MDASASAPSTPAPSPATSSGAPATETPGADNPHAATEAEIIVQLKKIYDPEIPMNIVDLGLVYGFDWKGEDLNLRMTLTAPGCPVAGVLADEIKGVVEKVPGVHQATVDYIWDPPWTPDRMSEFAKRQFGYL
ncbi:MAG: metal-sulfur cluster assembly factor [Thermoplasmata archaeon]|nr:metal-sulfur cluster assembly factor [Thermoplasmata archaeon]